MKPKHVPHVKKGEQVEQLSSWLSVCVVVFPSSIQSSSVQQGIVDSDKMKIDNMKEINFIMANLSIIYS